MKRDFYARKLNIPEDQLATTDVSAWVFATTPAAGAAILKPDVFAHAAQPPPPAE